MRLKNGEDIAIAKAQVNDAQAIVDCLNIIGGESDNLLFGANQFHIMVQAEKENIQRLQTAQTSALFVGKVGEKIISVGSIFAPTRERIAHQGELSLSVLKAYWGIGVGTHMMDALVSFARQNGICKVLQLSVRTDNVYAIRLYKRFGFEEVGVHKNNVKIQDAFFDVLLMDLHLD